MKLCLPAPQTALKCLLLLTLSVSSSAAMAYNFGNLNLGNLNLGNLGPKPVLTTSPTNQYDYQFAVRTGDINYDGRKDIHIKRLTGPSNNGVLSNTILYQQANGSFRVFPASSSQLSIAASWPVSSIQSSVSDLNADGFVDVALSGVSQAVGGAADLAVFSNKRSNGVAQVATNINANYKKTFGSLAHLMRQPTYFSDNIISVTARRWGLGYRCVYDYRRNSRSRCFVTWVPYTVRVTGYDGRKISAAAVRINNLRDSIEAGRVTKYAGSLAIRTEIQTVLRIVPGGLCAIDPNIILEYPDLEDCKGYELFVTIAANANAI